MKPLSDAKPAELCALCAALLMGSVACAGESSSETSKTASTSAPMGVTTSSAPETPSQVLGPALVSSNPRPGVSSATGAEATTLSDGQIAELASDVNGGELDQARYAMAHATDPRVKAFAQHMLTAHTNISAKMGLTLRSQDIPASSSPQSVSLKSEAHETLDSLVGKAGSDFDRAYMDAQVSEHQAALVLFDDRLIPNAQNASLKDSLRQIRPMVADHLREAKSIQGSLLAK
jgi:putative membrane protein